MTKGRQFLATPGAEKKVSKYPPPLADAKTEVDAEAEARAEAEAETEVEADVLPPPFFLFIIFGANEKRARPKEKLRKVEGSKTGIHLIDDGFGCRN